MLSRFSHVAACYDMHTIILVLICVKSVHCAVTSFLAYSEFCLLNLITYWQIMLLSSFPLNKKKIVEKIEKFRQVI
jgi:hypothetical protein